MCLHNAVDRGQSIRIIYVDFAEAFDHVDHNILVNKIMRALHGTHRGIIVQWMCSFLQGRRQQVKIDDMMSVWLPVNARMPQGSYPVPLMFIIRISGLSVGDVTHKFVDDTTSTDFLNEPSAVRMMKRSN